MPILFGARAPPKPQTEPCGGTPRVRSALRTARRLLVGQVLGRMGLLGVGPRRPTVVGARSEGDEARGEQ